MHTRVPYKRLSCRAMHIVQTILSMTAAISNPNWARVVIASQLLSIQEAQTPESPWLNQSPIGTHKNTA